VQVKKILSSYIYLSVVEENLDVCYGCYKEARGCQSTLVSKDQRYYEQQENCKMLSIPAQSFAGNDLDRSSGDRKDESFLEKVVEFETTRGVIISLNSILCAKTGNNKTNLHQMNVHEIRKKLGCENPSHLISRFQVVLLGKHSRGYWVVALDVTGVDSQLLLSQSEDFIKTLSFENPRSLLFKLNKPDLALSGQALALISWHRANRHCGKTGFETVPIECGMKRRAIHPSDSSQSPDKIYPRIDPVAIAAVISPDHQSILMGTMKRAPAPNFYSCLSGFVDICESVEEAIRREVWEESGVIVDVENVHVIGSQPWPIGRGGGCELMIGCIATASTVDIEIHDSDVLAVKWFSVPEIELLLSESCSRTGFRSPASSSAETSAVVVVPGPYAIAHHLLGRAVQVCKGKNSPKSIDTLPRPPLPPPTVPVTLSPLVALSPCRNVLLPLSMLAIALLCRN
jgi:NAD+ diphosphatase